MKTEGPLFKDEQFFGQHSRAVSQAPVLQNRSLAGPSKPRAQVAADGFCDVLVSDYVDYLHACKAALSLRTQLASRSYLCFSTKLKK